MSALEVQELLARLYTDPGLLQEFLWDREGFCRRHGNGDSEFVRQLDSRQLEFFASSLLAKRAGEVKKLLPMTVCALARRFDGDFNRYAATAIPTGDRRHVADAMAFCEHLLGEAGELNQLKQDAARFELWAFMVRFDLRREGVNPVVVQAKPGRWPWLRLRRFSSPLCAVTGAEGQHTSHLRRITLFARLPGLRGVWYW